MQDRQTVQSVLDQKLIRSGEKDRLKEYLRQRLAECGWRDQMRAYAKQMMATRPIEQIDVDDLVQELTPKGRGMVPESVKADLLLRIQKTLQDHDQT
ncbi:enhancer of yellow 2 transcription factor-like protein B-like protein [Phlyctochytrium arcticum]|nr:enhancer of yellow 2 transcription factor-like protein B-like protein [Phlyctochytrium arcticum]